MELTTAVGWVCLILGSISIIGGIWLTALHYRQEVPEKEVSDQIVRDHGAVTDAVKSVTDFAKALKDLDLGGKLLTVGVLLIAIAAISAGLDNVTEAIESAVSGD